MIQDEPFSGLDPINVAILKDIILEMKNRGKVLIFSTHQMEEAERLCDNICLINRGEKVLDERLSDIKSQYGKNRVVIAFDGDDSFLDDPDLVRRSDNYGNYVEIELQPNRDPQELLIRAAEGARIQRFEVAAPSLREIFVTSVGEDVEEAEGE